LLHEAFMRLIGQTQVRWHNRAHFFSLASRVMRRILVDHARARLAAKRGDGRSLVSLDHVDNTLEGGGGGLLLDKSVGVSTESAGEEVMGIDEALSRLEAIDPRQAHIVELRFFGGLTVEETAVALQISDATVKRDWVMAKAWLARELVAS
jgi:RNA polymerase sigma factor (TIGR02999 family)